jgi:hypothetical protein
MTHKEEFKKLVLLHIEREGIDKLMESLEKSDFYTAPASTRFHDSEVEGLVKHSIKVGHNLDDVNSMVSEESKWVVSLFHDICKIGYYKIEMRNAKNEKGNWEKVPYYTVDDKLPYGHGEKSVFMLQEYIKLTLEEAMAIRWHMCGFEPSDNYKYLGDAMKEFPLIIDLHYADLKASYVD